MRYYKFMCLIIAIDVASFGLISLFYKPHSGTFAFVVMKYSFFAPLIVVSVMQLAGLAVNALQGHVNTARMYGLVVIRYGSSPFMFFLSIAWELFLWTMPMYAILKFLAEPN